MWCHKDVIKVYCSCFCSYLQSVPGSQRNNNINNFYMKLKDVMIEWKINSQKTKK